MNYLHVLFVLASSKSLKVKRFILFDTVGISVHKSFLILADMLIYIGVGTTDNFDIFPIVKVSGVWLHFFCVVLFVSLSTLSITLVVILNSEMFCEELW